MKLTKVITIGLIAVLILALSAVFVLAQDVDAPTPPVFGPGSMWDNNGGYGRGGMMGGHGGMMGDRSHFGGGYMMNGFSMLDIIAQELGLSIEEIQAELANDVTIAQLAENQGTAVADLITAVSAAHQEQLNQAVADGWMTQEQADWMQEHMTGMIEDHFNQSWGQGFGPGQGYGPGSGGCHGGRFGSGPASQTAPVPQGNGA